MAKSYSLTDLDTNFFLNLPEVIEAKQRIDAQQTSGSIYFNVKLPSSVKQYLYDTLNINLSNVKNIPMRWIKGDTKPHIDRGINEFDQTYLVYLTDSEGELIVDGTSYPIAKRNAYLFSEGLSHETIHTGLEPRLLLGPMSETGIPVGGPTIYGPGGTTAYIRQDDGNVQYSYDQDSWYNMYYPIYVYNSDTSLGFLTIELTTDITFSDTGHYFYFYSDKIQFGSTSLKNDGTRPIITIDGVTDYPGLVNNGSLYNNGYSTIYIFNLDVRAINGSTLISEGGWVAQSYFGNGTYNNFIINCTSDGPIVDAGGGIVGAYSSVGYETSLSIIGCSSSGIIGINAGGIVGAYAGSTGGYVVCDSCWSEGYISDSAGGIFGQSAGYVGVMVMATKCYSSGEIDGTNAGGIFGQYAEKSQANSCYSQGNVSGSSAGGIYGGDAIADSESTSAINCYSSGYCANSTNAIYSGGNGDRTVINCYSVNTGSWSNSNANANLDGTPNLVVGTTWVSRGINTPYELNEIGYTPYTLENIIFNPDTEYPMLNQSYTQTIHAGQATSSAIRPDYSYEKLQISGGNLSSYGTITVNNSTGVISTTSSTVPGTYTIVVRNAGSYNITNYVLTVEELLTPTPSASCIFRRSLYTNNSQVFYKPHSLSCGGVGTVRNYRHKSRKT